MKELRWISCALWSWPYVIVLSRLAWRWSFWWKGLESCHETHKLCAPVVKMTPAEKGECQLRKLQQCHSGGLSAEPFLSRQIYDPISTGKWETWYLLSSSEKQRLFHSEEILFLFILRENWYPSSPQGESVENKKQLPCRTEEEETVMRTCTCLIQLASIKHFICCSDYDFLV